MEYLIPEEWFRGVQWPILASIAVAAFYVLVKGADVLVDGAAGLARRIGVTETVIGATVVSLGTTTPECAVSVMAAWTGNAGLALGNAVGSVIADSGLIFGVGCLLTQLPADRFLLSRQGWVQFGSALLLAAVCYAQYARLGDAATLSRPIGLLFLGLLAVYMLASVRWGRQHHALHAAEPDRPDEVTGSPPSVSTPPVDTAVHAQAGHESGSTPAVAGKTTAAGEATADVVERSELPAPERHSVWTLLGMVFGGLILVVVSSHVLIQSISEIARQFQIPQVVISGSIVAFGTSLPELIVGVVSIRRGHAELLVGNVIGADILNVLFVIGASAAAAPLPIIDPQAEPPHVFLLLHLPVMLVILGLFRLFIAVSARRTRFSRWMGVPLVLTYLAFVMLSYAR
ncbi:MAG: sodium:calcium antiporter [Planctomycetota bacterium]|nr:MAG: sodium:calcium antiporter [Planctomycetota bacterium]